jgi:small-conductance mechanosensitive channel
MQKQSSKAIVIFLGWIILSCQDTIAQNTDSMSRVGAIAHWFEDQLGLPPWFIVLIVEPIVLFLIALLVWAIVQRVIKHFIKQVDKRIIWNRIAVYLIVISSVLGLFYTWEVRMEWLASDLAAIFGNNAAMLLPYLMGILHAVLATMILILAIYLVNRVFHYAVVKIRAITKQEEISRLQKMLLMSSSRMNKIFVLVLRIIRFVLLLILFYYYIPFMLSFFPITEGLANKVMPYVTSPSFKLINTFVDYIPNLLTLILIVLFIKYFLRFLKNLFSAIEKGEIKIGGFEADWADQTFRLIRIVIILAGIIISYPFLPGSGSDIFKGFSIFIGALITLGSTSAVNNIVSGIVLTYTGAFRIGDRVKIGNTLGDVVEKKLFVTRIKTFRNEYVTFPNGQVLGHSIINLSAIARQEGLQVTASAGISYDVDWRKVHELMKNAANLTSGIIQTHPPPFVLETQLGDYAVTYELIGHTNHPKQVRYIEAELRRNLLDVFNNAGIEIMSPSVTAIRESGAQMIPEEYDPKPFSFFDRQLKK